MSDFKYGVSYIAYKDNIEVDSQIKRHCFSSLEDVEFNRVEIIDTNHKLTDKYRNKYLSIINVIYPIEWNKSKIIIPVEITDFNIRRLMTILMLIRVLHDDLGSGFDNVALIRRICKVNLKAEDILIETIKAINNYGELQSNDYWNSNHFLGNPPLRTVTLSEFYKKKIEHVNTFFSNDLEYD